MVGRVGGHSVQRRSGAGATQKGQRPSLEEGSRPLPPTLSLSLSLSRCLPRAPPGTHSAKAMRDTSRGHHLQAGERPRQKPSLRTPRSWTSGLQSHEERSAVSAACLCSAGAAQAAAEPEFSNLAGGHPTVGEAWRAPRARALGYCPPPTVSHLPVGEETLTLSGSHLRP